MERVMDDADAYAAEFWALDGDATAVCIELAPDYAGESVALSELDELCRRMHRPLRDDAERLRLMTVLDPENVMRIQRQAFTAWLLNDLFVEKQIREARERGVSTGVVAVPVAQPTWEEIIEESSGTSYYCNVETGESTWELSRFVGCLRRYLIQIDEVRALKAPSGDDHYSPTIDFVEDLRELFMKFDDDKSGGLDTSEFQDFCVAIGFLLCSDTSILLSTMQEVDPWHGSDRSIVTWEGLEHYWISNAPFQRRTRLQSPLDQWELIECLESKRKPTRFRHVTTQAERWAHPLMEQRVVDALMKIFPSTKLEWRQRINLFFDLQVQASIPKDSVPAEDSQKGELLSEWALREWRKALRLFEHDTSRKEHVEAAMAAVKSRFGDVSDAPGLLTRVTLEKWILHCVSRIESDGWEEFTDRSTGNRYYYHEIRGETQWDPPNLENHMSKMMARFSGDASASVSEKIKRIFRHYDADESGSISFVEFKRLYIALLGRKEALSDERAEDDAHIRQVFAALDTSGDDEVSLEEYMAWWKTKMGIEEEETLEEKRKRVLKDRQRIALEFLKRHDALIIIRELDESYDEIDNATGSARPNAYSFESNVLARLVGVLGKYTLTGLAYRNALNILVRGGAQQVDLWEFLDWYDKFEEAEREKEEIEIQKARALAIVQAKEAEAKEKARKLKMLRKGQLLTKIIAADAQTPAEPAELVWKRHVETLFKKFDHDNSGYLDASEMKQLTETLGHAMSETQVDQMMRVMDSSGDNRVSLDEFLTFWTAFQRRKKAQLAATKSPAKATLEDPHRRDGISMVDASASLSVRLEIAKDKALRLSIEDVRDGLGDWKDVLFDRSRRKKQAKEEEERARLQLVEWRRLREFIPTKRRRYAHLDVTWIEPDVVHCMVDMIKHIQMQMRPLQRQDAAQRIQRIVKGVVTRMRTLAMIQERFVVYVDLQTSFYYYVDTEKRGDVWLHRPVYRTLTSSVSPWELRDCTTKIETLQFTRNTREMQAKKQFHDMFGASGAVMCSPAQWKTDRKLYVPASFTVFTVLDHIRRRLLGSIWLALRQKAYVLVELIARRHRRQLRVTSDSDAPGPLPLHFVVQHHATVPFRVIKAVFKGFPEAVRARDAYDRTPLHLAMRSQPTRRLLELLLSNRASLINPPTRANPTSTSVWEMQTVTGDTPLHVALRYRVSLELLRWILNHRSLANETSRMWGIRNAHGQAVLHLVVGTLFCSSRFPYWRSVVLVLLRTWDLRKHCAYSDAHGDLPLHRAIQRYGQEQAKPEIERDHAAWTWLIETLSTAFPDALLSRRKHDALLPVNLFMKAGHVPCDAVLRLLKETVATYLLSNPLGAESLTAFFTLPATQTTLVHYALLHRAATSDELLHYLLDCMSEACRVAMKPGNELPLHIAVKHGASPSVVKRLCEMYGAACHVRDSESRLPIHLAATGSSSFSEDHVRLLLHYCPFVLSEPVERSGLRALVMAAGAATPHAGVLRALLDYTPGQKLDTLSTKRHVTPLYAISMRPCSPKIVTSGILDEIETKFEEIEDEDALFKALAKARRRKQHHCPTAKWSFPQILELMERNPVDEAVLQRSLLALNQKLTLLITLSSSRDRGMNECDGANAEEILEKVTLNPEWMVVRRVHQVMYETPWNARIQLLGQAVLQKLLPSAYAKTAYKARIDPYWSL